jgi:regulator of extracellular matrix RemA (YlzA/DUF370 family)
MEKDLDTMKFFVAGQGAYLPSTQVKAILDYEANVTKNIFRRAEASNLVNDVCSGHQKRRALIWMDNNTYILTDVAVDTINRRVNDVGTRTIAIGRGFYIPVDHISGVFDFNSNCAAKLRKRSETMQDQFSFVRIPKQVKNSDKKTSNSVRARKTTILLKSGENISVVYSPETIINKTSKKEN